MDTAESPSTALAAPLAMRDADLPWVIGLLRAAPQAALCDWEDPLLLRRHLADAPDLCRVVRDDSGNVMAAVIAGSFGVRGTISHIVVAPEHRRTGLARLLVSDVMTAFRRRGVRRVFLSVLDGNDAAAHLWSTTGFGPVFGETTYERDL